MENELSAIDKLIGKIEKNVRIYNIWYYNETDKDEQYVSLKGNDSEESAIDRILNKVSSNKRNITGATCDTIGYSGYSITQDQTDTSSYTTTYSFGYSLIEPSSAFFVSFGL